MRIKLRTKTITNAYSDIEQEVPFYVKVDAMPDEGVSVTYSRISVVLGELTRVDLHWRSYRPPGYWHEPVHVQHEHWEITSERFDPTTAFETPQQFGYVWSNEAEFEVAHQRMLAWLKQQDLLA